MSGVGMHARRPSNTTAQPELENLPSPYLLQRRTSRLDQRSFSLAGVGDRRPSASGTYRPAKGLANSRFAANSLRLIRSPRFLLAAFFCLLLYALRRQFSTQSSLLSRTPVPHAFLPIIQKSGALLNRISPAAAQRVKNWHDLQEAAAPRPLTEAELEAQSSHTFHPNGLLLVNPRGRHPIDILIERAQQRWNDKVAKQSKTLKAAVREYKQRYRRNPPKGFDLWWDFAQRNKVQLPDEYDQINHDLAPHRALEPSDSRHRNRVMQEREHTFTIAYKAGSKDTPQLYGAHAGLERATDLAKLTALFSGDLTRDLNITFIIDDLPAVMLAYAERDRMVELSEQGEYYGPSEFVGHDDSDLSNFARACASNSPLRRAERGEFTPDYAGTTTRSFIWDHSRAADLCQHPEARKLHGHTMQQGVPLSPLVPLFTFAKTRMHADILATPLEQYAESYPEYEPEWDHKSQNKLLWRGSTTGAEYNRHTPWKMSQRARLHLMSQDKEGDRSVIWSQRGAVRESNMSISDLNHLYMDTSFSGSPQQCDPETCDLMAKTLTFKKTIGLVESNTYKYLMDVDGNGWSGRFHRLMSTRSLVLKSTIFPEWYQDRIEPWVHYVPIKIDYSDIYDTMAYFVGTPDGQGGHDSIAEKIGESGRQWTKKYWRRADMASYMYRLVLEYTRLLTIGEDAEVDYVDPASMI